MNDFEKWIDEEIDKLSQDFYNDPKSEWYFDFKTMSKDPDGFLLDQDYLNVSIIEVFTDGVWRMKKVF